MKRNEHELQERCRAICEKHGLKYDPTPVKPSAKPSKKALQAIEDIERYGLPKEFYERMKEQS